ncbi:hypothetical protein PALB_19860 [Pseudoalteromonas luteoviolacea B = ATCC 29581]|nr:hypothetical protein PALB_19860 [Pseudoalteromonas luteoviolacea B = ATCC 29581]
MKTIFMIAVLLTVFMVLPFMQSPVMWFSMGDWFSGLNWVGVEFLTVFGAIVAVAVIVALVSIGIVAAILMAAFAVILVLLFNSIAILFPLFLILLVYWLVSDKKSVHT